MYAVWSQPPALFVVEDIPSLVYTHTHSHRFKVSARANVSLEEGGKAGSSLKALRVKKEQQKEKRGKKERE